MSEPKLISPMLDSFAMGDPISDHNGVRCCPAMAQGSDNKYIVKIISIPASQVQLDALLLTGAYRSQAEALSYFKTLSDGVVEEAKTLQELSKLEGFVSYENWQVVQMENEIGYDVYLLGGYHPTLERFFRRNTITHLAAVNLGLDLCAAMAVCRRSGYLYVDLKPSNIFISEDNGYRVGDLGFIKLDSLKYASLPDKYRSQYTAPEIKDAFSSLNSTLDIYAIGLILYQAFSGGSLPFADHAPDEPLPPPAYADYEMAEIILKACAPKPEDRWQDPIEMGQALVSYMQRNGANDTPITIPAPPVQSAPAAEEAPETADQADTAPQADPPEEVPSYVDAPTIRVPDPADELLLEQILKESAAEQAEDTLEGPPAPTPAPEDDATDLSFLRQLVSDETAPSEELAGDVEYHELSDDISDILNQADDLIAHEAPEPVVPPEPIDIPIPPPIVLTPGPMPGSEETEEDPEPEEETSAQEDGQTQEETVPVTEEKPPRKERAPRKKRSYKGLLITAVTVVLVGLLAFGGYFFYQNYYLQTIDDLTLVGTENELTVQLTTQIDSSALTVTCVDTFGNKTSSGVTDGKAVFSNLNPNTIYKVTVEMEGFHKLVGRTTDSYTTPAQTNIIQINAITGSTDGSVVLTFTVDGQEADAWVLTYFTEGGPEQTVSFTGHMVTVNGLTTGVPYTFRLSSETPMYITGTSELVYIPTPLVYAENLEILSCRNDTLEVAWSVPDGLGVESWTVRCYNDAGYDQTITTEETTAVFNGVDSSAANTVEVIAAGMSIGRQIYMTAQSLTVSNIQHSLSDNGELAITWDFEGTAPTDGWLLMYTIDGSEHQEILRCESNSATLSPTIPGAHYAFILQSADGVTIFGGEFSVDTPEADKFSNITSGLLMDHTDITPYMCLTPEIEDWDRFDLTEDSYTTTFSVGQSASFFLQCSHYNYASSYQDVVITYIIRDEAGGVCSVDSETRVWYGDMWKNGQSYMDIPTMPDVPGNYNITVYYDGDYVFDQDFTIQ